MAKLVVFSGAGISAESNIPTFQEIPEIREKLTRSFANSHPQEFAEVIADIKISIEKAQPNPAHLAIAEHDIPVITMNIDGLHERAGSKEIIAVHGDIDNIVLYGDLAPKYVEGLNLAKNMTKDDTLLVVGASYHTQFANEIRWLAQSNGARIVEIQEQAATEVPKFLDEYYQKDKIYESQNCN
jgi:NAD-dependent deacetylase